MRTAIELSEHIKTLKVAISKVDKDMIKLFDNVLTNYLSFIGENLIDTHIFYFKDSKVKLFDYYYPIKCFRLEIEKTKEKLIEKTIEISFAKPADEIESNNFILIEGGAGFGKSTIMKYAFLNSIIEKKKIPILINLHELNEYTKSPGFIINNSKMKKEDYIKISKSSANRNLIESFLYAKILRFDNYNKDNIDLLRVALSKGLFIIMFDGYDEIYSSNQQKIRADLESFQYRFKKNNFIITSRPGSKLNRISSVKKFKVLPLSGTDVENFIMMLNKSDEIRAIRIVKSLKNAKSKHYKDLLKNPLLLSMFVLTYESYPEIPKKRSEFYGNVFNTLYGLHKTRQGIIDIERKSKLDRSQYEKVMSALSYIFYMRSEFVLNDYKLHSVLNTINKQNIIQEKFKEDALYYDLTTSISILIQDGDEVHYPHRSIQEYFTALFISSLELEEDRKKAYSRLRLEKLDNITDNLSNLYDLLLELDPYGVKNYFVIDAISEYLKLFNTEDNNKNTENFIDGFDFYITIFVDNIHQENMFRVEIIRENDPIITTLEYFEYITSLSNLDKYTKIRDLEESISVLLKDDRDVRHAIQDYNTSILSDMSMSLRDFIDKHHEIASLIYGHFDSIDINNSFVKKLENDINNIKLEIINKNIGNSSIIDM